jgi:hypothetical protein
MKLDGYIKLIQRSDIIESVSPSSKDSWITCCRLWYADILVRVTMSCQSRLWFLMPVVSSDGPWRLDPCPPLIVGQDVGYWLEITRGKPEFLRALSVYLVCGRCVACGSRRTEENGSSSRVFRIASPEWSMWGEISSDNAVTSSGRICTSRRYLVIILGAKASSPSVDARSS